MSGSANTHTPASTPARRSTACSPSTSLATSVAGTAFDPNSSTRTFRPTPELSHAPPTISGYTGASARCLNAAASASRQPRSGVSPAAVHDAVDSTEYAGRGAGRGNASDEHGSIRDGS